MINVIDTKNNKQVATINHGFEPPKPPYDYEEQTMLDPLNRQYPMSDVFLDLFRDMVAKDEAYRQRLERHYSAKIRLHATGWVPGPR